MLSYRDRLFANHEHEIRQAHRHVLFVLLHTVPLVLLGLLLWGLAFLSYRYIPRFEGFIALVLMIASLVPFGIAIYRFMYWRAEEYIVTNLRIIQVEGILSKRTLDSSLGKVNDVEMTQSMFGRLFDFGNINIITGSNIAVNDLHGIDQPFQFKKALLEAKAEFEGLSPRSEWDTDRIRTLERETPARDPKDQVEDTARVLAALTELRNSGVLSDAEYQEKLKKVMAG